MAYEIPFHEDTYTPKTIKGNETDPTPVRFWLSAAGGADLARLKSVQIASLGLALGGSNGWSPETQKSVIAAFGTGADAFRGTIDKIENLTVPVRLAIKAGLVTEPPANNAKSLVVATGFAFSKVCPWLPVLALEIAYQIMKISDEAEVDARFFDSLTTSPKTPAATSGTVPRVQKARARRETAAGKTTTASTDQTSNP